MTSRRDLEQRIHTATCALSHYPVRPGPTGRRITAALEDLIEIAKPPTIANAWRHLEDNAAGYPATSMGSPIGTGTVSDRTGELVVSPYDNPDDKSDGPRPDQVTSELLALDELTTRLRTNTLQLLAGDPPYKLAITIETDARCLRFDLKRWARQPDVRWCKHCWSTNTTRTPVHQGRYKDLCRSCGEWRTVNRKLPPKEILEYLQRDERSRIPRTLLERHRCKVPRSRRY